MAVASTAVRTAVPERPEPIHAVCARAGPRSLGAARLGVDDDPDRVHVVAGLVEVFVRRRGIERDRVARAQLIALEADVGLQRAADDQAVLAPVVPQWP